MWKSVFYCLPPVGSAIEVKIGHSPDVTCGCRGGSISKVVAVPVLGEPWKVDETTYVTRWRFMQ